MINWNAIFSKPNGVFSVQNFVDGVGLRTAFRNVVRNDENAKNQVSRLEEMGVQNARVRARKALQRRGLF